MNKDTVFGLKHCLGITEVLWSVVDNGFGGYFNSTHLFIEWEDGKLIVYISRHDDELIDAISTFVGKRPFVLYKNLGMITFSWTERKEIEEIVDRLKGAPGVEFVTLLVN